MKCLNYFFLIQFAIFCELCNFSNAKAFLGKNAMDTSEGQFPFIVSISVNRKVFSPENHICTGSLISRKHVLTCAHCKNHDDLKMFCIIAGSNDLRKGNKYKLSGWISYLQWVFKSMNRMESLVTDISVITLSKEIRDFSFQPAIISNATIKSLYDSDVIIAGWSYLSNNELNCVLAYGFLKIITPKDCQYRMHKYFESKFESYETILCSSTNPYLLLNYGASGGPLLDTNNYILGVNQGRCPKKQPQKEHVNIHISVYHYREFILQILNT